MSSGACTPLYDAMGRTLTKLETQLAGDDNHSVVVRKNYQGVRSPSWGLWASVAAAAASSLSLGACCLGLLPVLLPYTFGEAIFLEMFDRMPVLNAAYDYRGAVLQAAPVFP